MPHKMAICIQIDTTHWNRKGIYMKKLRQILPLLLALLAFSACAAVGAEEIGESSPETATPVEESELVPTPVLTTEPLPGGLAALSYVSGRECKFALAGTSADGELQLGLFGGEGWTPISVPEDITEILSVCRTADGLTAAARRGQTLCLLRYDGELAVTDIAGDTTAFAGTISYAELDGLGYLMSATAIAEVKDGKLSRTLAPESSREIFTAICTAGGSIYVLQSGAGSTLWELNTNSFTLSPVDMDGASVSALGCTADGRLLVSCELGGREYAAVPGGEELFDWSEPGIAAPGYSYIAECEDGRYLLFAPGQVELTLLSEQLMPPKIALTLLTDYPRGELYSIINDFNRESTEYKVNVVRFGENGLTPERLQTELIAGGGPDIFAIYDRSSLDPLGDTAFEDLLPYLDTDVEFSRDTIVPSLLNAMALDGRLNWLPYSFAVSTFTAPSSLIPEPGVSFEEAEYAAESAGVTLFPSWMTRDVIWAKLSQFAVGQYIDFKSGTCSFDSDGYVRLLEQCAAATPELSDSAALMGSSLLQYELLQNLTRLSAISNTYGGEYTFAGAPNETTNGSMFATDLCFAISSASDEPDAAWQFVRTCLSGEHQRLNIDYLPAVAAVLEESINNAVENGIEWYGYEYELDSADADKLRELLTDTATVENAYPDIISILSEDAAQFFTGQVSARQAAQYTQDRVSTWLSERQ